MKTIALDEFKDLKNNDLYSMAKVEWWLMKYEDYYKFLKQDWYCPNKGCSMIVGGVCFCYPKSDEFNFLELFKQLNVLSQYQRKEEYFKQELEVYYKVKDNPIKLKELVVKNEQIGYNGFFDFLIEFLNYCDKAILLRVFDKSVLGYEVFVDNKEFKNTIEFLDIFSELFWEKEIFPESEILIEAKKDLEKN